jgi:hypothetical protein
LHVSLKQPISQRSQKAVTPPTMLDVYARQPLVGHHDPEVGRVRVRLRHRLRLRPRLRLWFRFRLRFRLRLWEWPG